MISTSDGNIITSAVESGQTITLTGIVNMRVVSQSEGRLLINSIFGVFYSYFWAGDSCFSGIFFNFTL